jgi:hypothetical protein
MGSDSLRRPGGPVGIRGFASLNRFRFAFIGGLVDAKVKVFLWKGQENNDFRFLAEYFWSSKIRQAVPVAFAQSR